MILKIKGMEGIDPSHNGGYVTDEVSSISANDCNTSEENRIKFVTDLAAISRGKYESGNPEKRYQSLLKEAALNTPSRPLEFIGVHLLLSPNEYTNDGYVVTNGNFNINFEQFLKLARFSYIKVNDNGVLNVFTNLRALINIQGIKYEDIPYNSKEELEGFKAIRINVPMFVWSQLMTHTMLSKESQSDRVAENKNYWLPSDLLTRVYNHIENYVDECESNTLSADLLAEGIKDLSPNAETHKQITDLFLNIYTQNEIQEALKELGYGREIWSRAPYYFKYKEMIMTGWIEDPKTWLNLCIERGAKSDIWNNWTQTETKNTVKAIEKILYKN